MKTQNVNVSAATDELGRMPPHGGLSDWSYDELQHGAEETDADSEGWRRKGDAEAAKAWRGRWVEICDELDRRDAAKPANPRTKANESRSVRRHDGSKARYQGPKRNRSNDPPYELTPIAPNGERLKPIDSTIAALVWQHNRRTYRAVKDKTKRITMRELASAVPCSLNTVKRSITRLLAIGVLEIERLGDGNHTGAIYRVVAR